MNTHGKENYPFAIFRNLNNESVVNKLQDSNITVSSSDSQGRASLCRFCLQSENENEPLISPCKCTGSMKRIHINCLRYWLTSKFEAIGNNQIVFLIQKDSLICEICKERYPWNINFNGKIFELLIKANDSSPYIILESVIDNVYFLIDFSSVSKIKIGRGQEVDLHIQDITISRKHLTIEFLNGKFLLKDCGSKFGTLVKTNKKTWKLNSTLNLLINTNAFKFTHSTRFSVLNLFGNSRKLI